MGFSEDQSITGAICTDAAVVSSRDGGGGEVERSGNPVGEVSARAVAARHVRAVSGEEAAYPVSQCENF